VPGFFAVRALTRPWRASVRGRVVPNLHLHVLWMLVGFGVALAVGIPTFTAPEHASGLPGAALTASTGLLVLTLAIAWCCLAAQTLAQRVGARLALRPADAEEVARLARPARLDS
jgi:uncharacterized membrane protein YcfT